MSFIILLVYILPIFLIQTQLLPYKLRNYGHTLGFVGIFWLLYLNRPSLFDLGIRTDNLMSGLLPYAGITFLMVWLLFGIKAYFKTQSINNPFKYRHFWFSFIILSFLQELAYRSILIPALYQIFSSTIMVIIFNSLIFAYLHVIYPHPMRNFFLSFLAGIFFATIYILIPNLWLITISHSIINNLALYFQIIGPKLSTQKN